MATVDDLRNNIIDKLLAISSEDYLSTIYQIIDQNNIKSNKIILTKQQIEMLEMSENDIQNSKLISQEDLDNSDLKWLKEL